MAHNPILYPKQRGGKTGRAIKLLGFFPPVLSSYLSAEQSRRLRATVSDVNCISALCFHLHFGRHSDMHHPQVLCCQTAESNSQQDLRISLTDKDKEGEQSEKARGLNTFQVSEWKERTNLDSESWALSVRVNGLWQQGSFGSSLLAT